MGLLIPVDPDGRDSLQRQICTAVRAAILDGKLAPGSQLPSSRALAADLGVSRTTTLLAYEQLTAEGYLTGQRGSGTFVARELPDAMPRARHIRPATKSQPPPISRRGAALAASRRAARRVGAAPRPFRIGVPALDQFPIRLWSQLAGRYLRAITLSQLDYGDSGGLPQLRRAIAEHVSTTRGTRCDAEQVIVIAGAQRGLDLTCRILLDPGDHAWMEEPGYPGAQNALISAGARIQPIPVDKEGLDVAAGARRSAGARVVYVTPSHQYPTGVPMSLPRRLALLRWAGAARAWIIEDDYDSEFRHGARPIPCLHGLDVDGRVVYVGTFAKTLFPAIRLGFLILPPPLVGVLRAARRAADLHPPTLEQAVLAQFMLEGHYATHLRRMRAVYRERLQALEAAARRYLGGALTLRPIRTGLHVVADLHGVSAPQVAEDALAAGVEVMPLSAYYWSRREPANALVLGFGCVRPEDSEDGMRRLASAIESAARAKNTAGVPTATT
jgi:GntR family transcriptional regulator/MocR family aminotransferase